MAQKTTDLVEKSIDTIIARVTADFTNTITNMIGQFSNILTDTVNTNIAAIIKRLDILEDRLAKCENMHGRQESRDAPMSMSQTDADTGAKPIEDLIVKTVVAIEGQREQLSQKAKNVIVSGLKAVQGVSDVDVFSQFCEQNLTIKPRIVRARRLGKSNDGEIQKLCITLDNSEAVSDLIESSFILRQSTNEVVKKIYFNRDLTRAQAAAEYQARCLRRSSRITGSTQLNANAASFSVPPL